MGDIGGIDGFVGVGEERVIPPDRKQRIGVAGIFDATHDQSRGDWLVGGTESGVGRFSDFGIGDPCSGIGVAYRAGVLDRGPGVVADRGDQRRQTLAQDLLAGDLGMPVAGTLSASPGSLLSRSRSEPSERVLNRPDFDVASNRHQTRGGSPCGNKQVWADSWPRAGTLIVPLGVVDFGSAWVHA